MSVIGSECVCLAECDVAWDPVVECKHFATEWRDGMPRGVCALQLVFIVMNRAQYTAFRGLKSMWEHWSEGEGHINA